jgi:hypothetical protein
MNTQEQDKTTEDSIQSQLNAQQEALVKIYTSVEKTRKIMFWTGVANLVVFVLPLIFVVLALPMIMNTFTSSLGGLSESTNTTNTVTTVPSLSDSLQNLKDLGL